MEVRPHAPRFISLSFLFGGFRIPAFGLFPRNIVIKRFKKKIQIIKLIIFLPKIVKQTGARRSPVEGCLP